MLFVCYEKCGTCKKALAWLESKGFEPQKRDIKSQNPSYEELQEWVAKSGLNVEKFFNTSGMIYRENRIKDKLVTMSYEDKLQLLSTQGMLVKRPILVNEDTVLVGFNETKWAEKLL